MQFTHFTIKNFKGIEEATIDLLGPPRSKVHTLIGLNESGKTTLLEAMNLVNYREELDALDMPGYATRDPHELIPVSKRSNFNGKITVEAGVRLDVDDRNFIELKLLSDLGIKLTSLGSDLRITQTYEFKDSRAVSSTPINFWNIDLKGTEKGKRKAVRVQGTSHWPAAVAIIKPLVPRVVYFPNFLFAFPDKIYIESPPEDAEKHKFYRGVLQDVLDAIGEHTNLDDHILARAKSGTEADKRSLESVLLKMSGHISESVFKNWEKVFRRAGASARQSSKEIVVTIDKEPTGAWYVQLRLKDGIEAYSISERSLGFRWFFTYLLLTQYRGFRKAGNKNITFLLDEPASNLHPSAQTQLLDSFENLPEGCQVVYTTHSHHMIRPDWLEGAYVVRNSGLDYSNDQKEYSSRRTLVKLDRYRKFAAAHPDQTTYFQPVLDVLNYSPNRLENIPDVVMMEGKGDFYTMKFLKHLVSDTTELNVLPGTGAGSLDSVIRLYIAWGRNFIVLLDSDKEGRSQKDRYDRLFGGLVKDRIFSLGDLLPELADCELEEIVSEPDRLSIQASAYPAATSYNKTQFARAIQEITLTKRELPQVSVDCASRAKSLLTAIDAKLVVARAALI